MHPSRLAVLAAAFVCVVAPATATADYPERPIRLVVPYPPGGGTDATARLIAEKLSIRVKQPLIVDNRAGANGNIGADAVAKAQPDGYTLLFAGLGPLAVNPSLFARMPYDPAKDFAPVVKISTAPLVLVAGPAISGGMAGLLSRARSKSGALTVANAGEGSPQHICAGLFARAAGISVTHVPYKGAAPAITDVIGGQIDALCENLGTIRPFIESKKVQPLGVTTRERIKLQPGLPTLTEQGLRGVEFSLWFMLVAPAGTPPQIVARLNREVNDVLAMPEVIARLQESANEPVGGSVAAAAEHLQRENRRWPEAIKALGLAKQ